MTDGPSGPDTRIGDRPGQGGPSPVRDGHREAETNIMTQCLRYKNSTATLRIKRRRPYNVGHPSNGDKACCKQTERSHSQKKRSRYSLVNFNAIKRTRHSTLNTKMPGALYVCVCVYMCICVHESVHACIGYMCMSACKLMCVYVYTCMCVHVRVCAYVCR